MGNTSQAPWVSYLSFVSIQIASCLVGSKLVFFVTVSTPTQDLAFLLGSSAVGFLFFYEMESIPFAMQWISPGKYSVKGICKRPQLKRFSK